MNNKTNEANHHKAMNQIVTTYHELHRVQAQRQLEEYEVKFTRTKEEYEAELKRTKAELQEKSERVNELEIKSDPIGSRGKQLDRLSLRELDTLEKTSTELVAAARDEKVCLSVCHIVWRFTFSDDRYDI